MSIVSGIFTAEDGTEIKLSSVVAVEPSIGDADVAYYNIIYPGGLASVRELYTSRTDFLTAWRTAT